MALLLSLALVSVLPAATPVWAGAIFKPVDVMYMVKDPSSPNGYSEKLRWQVNSANDWANFYDNLPNLPTDNTANSDPLNGKVEDMIVFTHTDDNGLTGFDIYVSSLGIMKVNRNARHAIYPDTNQLRSYLSDEQKQRASFEELADKAISKKTFGIVVTYNINDSIPNPIWTINTPDELRIYDSFFKALQPLKDRELKEAMSNEDYDGLGNFVMNLNYPRAPARIATVGRYTIRLSNGYVSTDFYVDTQNFYKFFKDQAREMIKFKEKYKNTEQEAINKRQF